MVSSSRLLTVAGVASLCQAWPGMRKKTNAEGEEYIGPDCTVGAHNWHPNMDQPPPPTPSSDNLHVWPDQFVVDWKFYFVPDDADEPPYNPLPTTPYNMTNGKTYYFNDPGIPQLIKLSITHHLSYYLILFLRQYGVVYGPTVTYFLSSSHGL